MEWVTAHMYPIGTYTVASGGKYEGQWDDDMTVGRGKILFDQ